MKKTLKKRTIAGIEYTVLDLPNTGIFQYEVVQKMGSNIEKIMKKYDSAYNKEVYGVSHLIEHMCFKESRDYTTDDIKQMLKDYGVYNASTSQERVNYYYKGTMEDVEDIISLTNNIAFNDLKKVPQEEFELEREVVFNEAKLYYDDDHAKFSFDETTVTFGLDIRDNILGSLETIMGLELEDLIKIKKIMNVKENQAVNIAYDSSVMSEDELLNKISKEIAAYALESSRDKCETYKEGFPEMKKGEREIPTDAEQVMYSFTFDMEGHDPMHVSKTLGFLNDFSKHSLTEEVREKRGLTYNIGTGAVRMGRKEYYQVYCNISEGHEKALMEGIKEAMDKTKIELKDENFKKFKKSRNTQRKLAFLNLNSYMRYIWVINENKGFYERYKDELAKDLDGIFEKLDNDYTLEIAEKILVDIVNKFETKEGSEVWGKKAINN